MENTSHLFPVCSRQNKLPALLPLHALRQSLFLCKAGSVAKYFHRSARLNACSVTGQQRLNRVGCKKDEEDSRMARKEDSLPLLNFQCNDF